MQLGRLFLDIKNIVLQYYDENNDDYIDGWNDNYNGYDGNFNDNDEKNY